MVYLDGAYTFDQSVHQVWVNICATFKITLLPLVVVSSVWPSLSETNAAMLVLRCEKNKNEQRYRNDFTSSSYLVDRANA